MLSQGQIYIQVCCCAQISNVNTDCLLHQTKCNDYVRWPLNGHDVNVLFFQHGMHVFYTNALIQSLKTQTFSAEVVTCFQSFLISFYPSCLMFILFILKAKQKQKQVCLLSCLFLSVSKIFTIYLRTPSIMLLQLMHFSVFLWLCTLLVTCRATTYQSFSCVSWMLVAVSLLQHVVHFPPSVLVACADWTCPSIWCGPFHAASGAGGPFPERLWGETTINTAFSVSISAYLSLI